MADSGSMNGASAITGSWSTGSESLSTSKRSAALEAKTARPCAPRASSPAAELGLHALEVGAQRGARLVVERLVLADQARRAIEDRADLGAARRGGRELARVEAEEEREHLGLAGADAREAAQALVGDVVGLHGATLPRSRGRCRAGVNAPGWPDRSKRDAPLDAADTPLTAHQVLGRGVRASPRGKELPHAFPVRWPRCVRLCKRSSSKDVTCASS